MRIALVVALLLLPMFPLAVASAPRVTLEAGTPDGWRVPLVATVEADGTLEVPVALDMTWTSDARTASWTEAWPDATVRGNATLAGSFVAEHGEGRYEATLRVGDGASAPVVVTFEEPAPATAETMVTWDGVSSSARLALSSDSVNANGKLKFPGEDVVTRFVAEDAGGLAGELRVDVQAEDGRKVASERLRLPGGTRASLEHRIALSPLAVGNYTLAIASDASSVRRTFTIKDASPVVLDASAPATTRAGRSIDVVLTLGDRNLDDAGRMSGALVAKAYRASTALAWTLASGGASGDGSVPLDLATATADDPTWNVADGFGTVVRRVTVHVPAGAAPATYRLAVTRNADKVGEAFFDVVPPPAILLRATAARPGDALLLEGTAAGLASVRVEVSGVANATADVPVRAGAFSVAFPLDRGLATGARLAVRASGEDAATSLDVLVENVAPEVALEVRHAGLRGPARVLPGARVDVAASATDANGDAPSVRLRLVDAAGAEVARGADGALRVPAGLLRGAYAVEAVATDASGAVSRARHPIAVGAWVEAGFIGGEVRARRVGDALEAAATIVNTGNVDVGQAVLLVGALAGAAPVDATLTLADGTAATAPVVDGRARFDVVWPPGEARIDVRWGRPADDAADRSAPLVVVVKGADA